MADAARHTPGPWAYDGVSAIRTADGEPIAELEIENAVDDRIDADAYLIAAAPDLLAALKRFRTKVYNAAIGSGMDDEWATEACSLADAAIDKAEGGAA